jgi:hypothetical protein
MPGVSSIAPWATIVAQTNETVPELRWPRRTKTYEAMLTDSQAWGLYSGTVMPLLDYDWWIHPNGIPETDARLQALAADVGLPINAPAVDAPEPHRPDGSFDHGEHLIEALLAPVFGHYFFELAGHMDGDLWRLDRVAPRPPSTLAEINPNPDGTLKSIRQSGMAVDMRGSTLLAGQAPEIPAESLAAYVWWPAGQERWLGRSIMRPMYRSWLCKDVLIRVDVTNHNRAGGVPVITTDERYQGQDLQDLQRLAAEFNVDEEGGAALPPGATLNLARVGGTDTIGSIRYHDEQMAVVWQQMVRTLAQTPNGSRALGGTFQDLETMARRAIAGWYARRFSRTVLGKWWSWNVDPKAATTPILRYTPPAVEGVAGPALDPAAEPPPVTAGGRGNPPRAAAGTPSPPPGGTGATAEADRGGAGGGAAHAHEPGRAAGARGAVRAAAPSDPPISTLALTRSRAPDRPVRRALYPHEVAAATDFQALDAAYMQAADLLDSHFLQTWLPSQMAALGDAINYTKKGTPRQRVRALDLAKITAPVVGQGQLAEVLLDAARRGHHEALAELGAQGAEVAALSDDALAAVVADHSQAVAQMLAEGVTIAATRKAVQLVGERTAAQIANETQSYLGGLTHRWERDTLAGAVQQAQVGGRLAVFSQVEPMTAFYATELLDSATCEACRAIDGTNFPSLAEARMQYPSGGYVECFGGPRCRGSVVGVYAGEGSPSIADPIPVPAAPTTPPLTGDAAVTHARQTVVPLPEELDEAIKTYGRTAYQPVNDYLRGMEDPGDRRSKLDELIVKVDGAISMQKQTTAALELHRYSYTRLDIAEGESFVDPAYVSTSLKADAYGGSAPSKQGDLLRIFAPPGTRGADMVGLDAATSEQEHEYLLPRGSRFRVESIDDSGPGARRVNVTLEL